MTAVAMSRCVEARFVRPDLCQSMRATEHPTMPAKWRKRLHRCSDKVKHDSDHRCPCGHTWSGA